MAALTWHFMNSGLKRHIWVVERAEDFEKIKQQLSVFAGDEGEMEILRLSDFVGSGEDDSPGDEPARKKRKTGPRPSCTRLEDLGVVLPPSESKETGAGASGKDAEHSDGLLLLTLCGAEEHVIYSVGSAG